MSPIPRFIVNIFLLLLYGVVLGALGLDEKPFFARVTEFLSFGSVLLMYFLAVNRNSFNEVIIVGQHFPGFILEHFTALFKNTWLYKLSFLLALIFIHPLLDMNITFQETLVVFVFGWFQLLFVLFMHQMLMPHLSSLAIRGIATIFALFYIILQRLDYVYLNLFNPLGAATAFPLLVSEVVAMQLLLSFALCMFLILLFSLIYRVSEIRN